jgi:16S rRNA (guanine527-N7)-methyltransferase
LKLETYSVDLSPVLAPFLDAPLAPAQQAQIQACLDLLLRWNARVNLTAVRRPEYIVSRHFGESLFAARHLLPAAHLLDFGSGAGFPGLPMKIFAPALRLTLIESRHKKAAFLREVVRALALRDVEVFSDRAERFPATADLVTLRAVENFERSLPAAARLVSPAGRLALLIGQNQVSAATRLLPLFRWSSPVLIPQSRSRVLLAGQEPSQ